MRTSILILGAGGHGIVVADIIQSMSKQNQALAIRGFLDDDTSLHGKILSGAQVLGGDDVLKAFPDDLLVVAVGDNPTRKKIAERLTQSGRMFFTAVHASAVISPSTVIGEGCMICANAVLNPESTVGSHVILNTGCTVDHHNQIGDFVHLAPGVHTGGHVTIGEGTMAGIGSSIIPFIKIGKWSMIGTGSVVTRDVNDGMTACGNPARSVRRT